MRSLYLRIWLTVVAALAMFAAASGWLVHRHLNEERQRFEGAAQSRAEAWGELLQRSLPPADAPPAEQEAALRDWSQRLRLPMALDDASGRRIGASESYLRREADAPPGLRRGIAIRLDDGRTLWIARRPMRPGGPGAGPQGMGPEGSGPGPWRRDGPPAEGAPGGWRTGPAMTSLTGLPTLPGLPGGASLVLLLGVLFLGVAAGAWPVVRRLTRRLEALKAGVEAFGGGALHQRVAEQGQDEVAAVAASFNRAAARVESLVRSHQNLLANASHELRSPLARMKMAVSLLPAAEGAARERLLAEVNADVAELDALVEEVLLASRLDASAEAPPAALVELLALATEEASRAGVGANGVEGVTVEVQGDERLLRRALRNLLENARRYAGGDVSVYVGPTAQGPGVEVRVCDRGPGVPAAYAERIFEPFFRLPGHAEREGGVGLGLSLVRQIAQRHGGGVRCEPREGGGSCFVLTLPRQSAVAPGSRAGGMAESPQARSA